MNQQQLGANLQQLRQKHKISQEELSERINVSRQAISKWERGEATPDIYNLKALSDLYQVTIDDIVTNNLTHSALTTMEPEQQAPLPMEETHSLTANDEATPRKEKRKMVIFPIITLLCLLFSGFFSLLPLGDGGEGFIMLAFALLIPAIVYFSMLFSKQHYAHNASNLALNILSVVFIFVAMLLNLLFWAQEIGAFAPSLNLLLLFLPIIISLTHLEYLYVNKVAFIIISFLFLAIDLITAFSLFDGGVQTYFLLLSGMLAIFIPGIIIISELRKSQKPTSKFVIDIIAIVLLTLKTLLALVMLMGSTIPAWLFVIVWVVATIIAMTDHILSLVLLNQNK